MIIQCDTMLSECIDPGQLQELLHAGPRVEHPCFNGIGWDPDNLGCFIHRFLMIVDEIEYFPVGRRKLRQTI